MLVLPINTKSFSHASGSIPILDKFFKIIIHFFPREWEYTLSIVKRDDMQHLFPTRVGVYPFRLILDFIQHTFSHASGSIPLLAAYEDDEIDFFPREWEYTLLRSCLIAADKLFPTRVGVYLRKEIKPMILITFSHASGSIPLL